MSSSILPIALTAKTPQDITRQLALVQAAEGGKVSIVAIYYDSGQKLHVLWYLPLQFNGGVF